MKKRTVAVVMAAAMTIGMMVTGVSVQAGVEDKTLIVGFDAEYPPFGYKDDNGEYVGFDLDLAQEVCDNLGWELVKKPINWDSKDMELNSGNIDCIWNGFTMNGREDDYEWSKPYMKNNQVFVVRGDSDINSEADLAGKNVEVQTDSSAEAALNDNSELTSTFGSLTPVADYNTAFMDLESGAVDAIAMDDVVASYQITSRKADFKVLDDVIAASHGLNGFFTGENSLYKIPGNGSYQLIIHQSSHTAQEFNKVCNILSEYGKGRACTPAGEAHLIEHGELISTNALQQLIQL